MISLMQWDLSYMLYSHAIKLTLFDLLVPMLPLSITLSSTES